MKKIKQSEMEEATKRALALAVAKEYCKINNLSYDKLCKQRFYLVNQSAIFAQPSSFKSPSGSGLTNDMATMPMPTLILKNNDDVITIEETEHTRKYLV
jgi:hypothetical protein